MSRGEERRPPPSASPTSPPPGTGERARDDITTWADRIEATLARERVTCIDRVAVVAETASTQDLARRMAAGRPGLLVLAGRQTSGRGRLGRSWADTSHLGLAATFVLDARTGGEALPIAAGLAACMTVEQALAGVPAVSVGLRWPNDVVERVRVAAERGDDTQAAGGRKLGGVLVEAMDGLAFVGIGLNVGHRAADWPEALVARAVSLRQLGAACTRIDAAEALVTALDWALRLGSPEIAAAWGERDVLIGCRAIFEHGGRRYAGIVRAVRPTSEIEIESQDGVVQRLPAPTTSLLVAPT